MSPKSGAGKPVPSPDSSLAWGEEHKGGICGCGLQSSAVRAAYGGQLGLSKCQCSLFARQKGCERQPSGLQTPSLPHAVWHRLGTGTNVPSHRLALFLPYSSLCSQGPSSHQSSAQPSNSSLDIRKEFGLRPY